MSNLLKSKSLLGITIVAVMFAAVLMVGAFAFTANAQQADVTATDIQYAATVKQGSSGQAVLIWQKFSLLVCTYSIHLQQFFNFFANQIKFR